MTMTGAEFKDYIVRTFIRTDKDDEIYEAITDVINTIKQRYPFEAFKKISYVVAFDEVGEYSFKLPEDLDHIIGDVIFQNSGESIPLIKVSKERYDQLEPFPDDPEVSTGRPSHYTLYQNAVYLHPVPDSISYRYQINYATNSQDPILSGTIAVPFTDFNRLMLKELVLGKMFADLGDDVEGKKHRDEGELLLGLLVEKEKTEIETVETVEYKDI